jgi:hypothetical protein
MGLLDMFTGSKPAAAGAAKKSAADLRTALLAVNRESAPWQVRDGAAENCDLVAEWKIVDARWYEIFAKASLSKVFKILMKIDEAKGEVRAVNHEFTVDWRAGVPSLAASVEAFRGQKVEMSFGTAYGFKEDLGLGKIYEYRFNTKEIKEPLQDVVTTSGYAWKGVAFGKL